jgi:RHS repeat-associated protein
MPYRYTGQRAEPTGLYFYNARWYDPAIGRFLQLGEDDEKASSNLTLLEYSVGRLHPGRACSA